MTKIDVFLTIIIQDEHAVISQRLNTQLEMTRRISDEEADEINLILGSLENVNPNIDQLVDDMREPKWNSPSIINPLMPYYALLAHQENKLSQDDFATLLIHWSARQQHQQTLRAITPQDKAFRELLKQTLVTSLPHDQKEQLQNSSYPLTLQVDYSSQLSPEQFASFLADINTLPKSQQVFFMATEEINLLKTMAQKNVADRLTALNFSPLGRPQALNRLIRQLSDKNAKNSLRFFSSSKIMTSPPEVKTLIPSIELMRAYLKTKFGEQAVWVNPVIGLSTEQDIIDGCLKAMRDMAVHFPQVKLPATADGILAEWFDFTLHDFYHAFAASAIPAKHKELFIRIRLIAKSCLLDSSDYKSNPSIFDLTLSSLIDMEHSPYRSLYTLLSTDKKEKPETLFLLVLTIWLNKKIIRSLPAAEKQKLFESFAQFILVQASEIANTLPDYLASIQRNFKSNLEISQTANDFFKAYRNTNSSLTFFNNAKTQTGNEIQLTTYSQRLYH